MPLSEYNTCMARAATTSDVFNAIAEEHRREILDALRSGEMPVGAIVDELRTQDWLSRRARRRFSSDERNTSAAVVGIEDLPEERRNVADDAALTPETLVAARSEAKSLAKAVERCLVAM